jgi:hypothetical protein
MPINLKIQTVFECKCILCGHEWEAKKKPFRCAGCKNRGWNGEDHRFQNPYHGIPLKSQIKTGTEAPRPPNSLALLETLTNVKAVIEMIIAQNPCDHKHNQCVCEEKELVAQIDGHIARLDGLRPLRKTYLVQPAT